MQIRHALSLSPFFIRLVIQKHLSPDRFWSATAASLDDLSDEEYDQ
jgi:hypothetical protein